ncbi:MAG: hypothetical protein RI964_3089, partial [Pseudomonadota bacterium]
FADHLAGAVNVRIPVKHRVHKRQPGTGYRAYRLDPRQTVEGGFQRETDQALHLFGSHAARFGHQCDGGTVEVGEDFNNQLNMAAS